ncbi:MAG: hypothetical protein ACJ8FS_06260 [Sphingomicrobium sp.]
MRAVMLLSVLLTCACSSRAHPLTDQEKMQAAKRGFEALDLNHDGTVSRQEWSIAETRAAAPIPQASRAQFTRTMDEDFSQIDRNHDSKIAFAEYTANHFGKDRQPRQ